MRQLTISLSNTESRIVEAQAILRGIPQEKLVADLGVEQIITQATQEQVQADVTAGTVGDDVTSLVDWNSLWQGVQRERQAGRMPESVVEGLERRATAMLDAKHVGGAA